MKDRELLRRAIKDFYGEGRPDKEVPDIIKRNLKDEEYVKSLKFARNRHKTAPQRKYA